MIDQPKKSKDFVIWIIIIVISIGVSVGYYLYDRNTDVQMEIQGWSIVTRNPNQSTSTLSPTSGETCDYDDDCEMRTICADVGCYNVNSPQIVADCVEGYQEPDLDNKSCVCAERECALVESVEPTTTYRVDSHYNHELVGPNYLDTKIVRVTDDQEETVVNSISTMTGQQMAELAFPAVGDYLYLKDVQLETDNAAGEIWSYNLLTTVFSKLEEVNEVFIGWGALAIDPSKTKIAYVVDSHMNNGTSGLDQTLYLLDLVDDIYRELVTLEGNETFNQGWGALSSVYDISWTDATTISYLVYDQSSAEEGSDKDLIEARTIDI